MSRPILAVDIDGVVSLFGFEETPPGVRFQLVDGFVHCLSLDAAGRVRRLEEHFELVWASGWEDKANYYLPAALGLPELPHLSFDGAARAGTAHWKLAPLDAYCRGRAMAWIDDNLDESCYEWARRRPEPTLLVPTESHRGLGEAETEALADWARALEA
ncbi:MAG: hypothetical protein ACM3NW_08845 [Syntrophomonadaceae bacterium]